MKYILFALILVCSYRSFSQDTTSNILQYKDGYARLNKMIFSYVGDNYNVEEVKHSAYSNFNITIDKNGKVVDVNIFSVDDSSLSTVICKAIYLTDGKWINATGENQILNLPINCIYVDDGSKDKNIPFTFYSNYYENGRFKNVVHFKPMTIYFYPTVK